MGEWADKPVPEAWRDVLKRIVDAFTEGNIPAGDGIRPVNAKTAKVNFENIRNYPDTIGTLRQSAWETSVCSWMDDHWDVLVDLNSVDGALTDLVLRAKVFDVSGRVEVEPGLIYVP